MTLTELLKYQIEKYTELLAIASTDGARSLARAEVYRLKRKLIEIEEAQKFSFEIYEPVKTETIDQQILATVSVTEGSHLKQNI